MTLLHEVMAKSTAGVKRIYFLKALISSREIKTAITKIKGIIITAKNGFILETNWPCNQTILNGIKVNSADKSRIMKIFFIRRMYPVKNFVQDQRFHWPQVFLVFNNRFISCPLGNTKLYLLTRLIFFHLKHQFQ